MFAGMLMITIVSMFLLAADTPEPFARWEQAIRKYEEKDSTNPPPKNGIIFAGSSSMVLWDLKHSFPDLPVINRGFGGSKIPDSTYFMKRIITPHQPRIVVFYAGDNDIAAGRSADEVRDDFRAFVKALHQECPKTKILFLSIKYSMSRWHLRAVQERANILIQRDCVSDERVQFVDVATLLLGEDGRPSDAFFLKDRLHLSGKGYEVWTAKLAPLLK